jgi:transcriptional regulator with XRE-family HTH domain
MNDSQFLQEIGARIKKLRTEKNMSQNELAMLCDFEKASMSRIESGQTNTTILTLRKIGHALGVHVCELLQD